MIPLSVQLGELERSMAVVVPNEINRTVLNAKVDIKRSFRPEDAIQPGARLPEFTLPNAVGDLISSTDLLDKGPILIVFYRGGWCPFCSLTLRAFQHCLDDIVEKGVTFVAVSPELPDKTLSTVEKSELKYTVLSDAGLKFARELGIVWSQPQSLRPAYEALNIDLKEYNGDDTFELPIPTTLLVDQQGIVRNVFIEADYFKRLEPLTTLEWINDLQSNQKRS